MALQHARSRTSPPSVLLVDDDHDTLQLYSACLRFSGLQVWTAPNASAALSSARKHHPDVVVTDIGLPGADGWSLCRQLRADPGTHACGVIALTGWVYDAELSARAREAAVDLVLTKPCLPDVLLAQIAVVRRQSTLLQARAGDAISRSEKLRTKSTRLGVRSGALHKGGRRRAKR